MGAEKCLLLPILSPPQAREWVALQEGELAASRLTYAQLLDRTFSNEGGAGWRRAVDAFAGGLGGSSRVGG